MFDIFVFQHPPVVGPRDLVSYEMLRRLRLLPCGCKGLDHDGMVAIGTANDAAFDAGDDDDLDIVEIDSTPSRYEWGPTAILRFQRTKPHDALKDPKAADLAAVFAEIDGCGSIPGLASRLFNETTQSIARHIHGYMMKMPGDTESVGKRGFSFSLNSTITGYVLSHLPSL